MRYRGRRAPVVMSPSVLRVLLALTAASSVFAQDSFLESARTACLRQGHLLTCAKYKIANLVHRIASTQRSMDLGPLRLVSIPRANVSQEDSLMARASDFAPQEPELLKMFKYGVRQLDLFLGSHGLSLPLASVGAVGPYVVGDDGSASNQVDERATSDAVSEGRGRNLHLIVPLLIMVKLMSIKALLIPTLLGVAAIKKFIILTVMLLPSIIHKLKACKVVPHLVHYTPHHTHSHEFHDDYFPHHHEHDHHEHHDHEHHDALHHSDIHRRLAHYRSIKV